MHLFTDKVILYPAKKSWQNFEVVCLTSYVFIKKSY
jgi:hypothetical protein